MRPRLIGLITIASLALFLIDAHTASAQPQFQPWLHPTTKRPFFPRGWYLWEDAVIAMPPGRPAMEKAKRDLSAIADESANVVLFANSWTYSTDEQKADEQLAWMLELLDHAEACGVMLIPLIGTEWRESVPPNGDRNTRELFKRWVQTVSQHPAFLGYNLYDEPEFRFHAAEQPREVELFAQELVALRTQVRRWDPNPDRLCSITFNVIPPIDNKLDWRPYIPALDAALIDRYPANRQFEFFPKGEWGLLRCAWQIAHGRNMMKDVQRFKSPAIVMQGIGATFMEGDYHWRAPLYDESRYMAYSSINAGSWGAFHFILNRATSEIRHNVARLYAELEQLEPAFAASWKAPPFRVSHNHESITRDHFQDFVPDVSTTALADDENYYLIVCDNTGVLEDLRLSLRFPADAPQPEGSLTVLNEGWTRDFVYHEDTRQWSIAQHTMVYGDVNIFVVPKQHR